MQLEPVTAFSQLGGKVIAKTMMYDALKTALTFSCALSLRLLCLVMLNNLNYALKLSNPQSSSSE